MSDVFFGFVCKICNLIELALKSSHLCASLLVNNFIDHGDCVCMCVFFQSGLTPLHVASFMGHTTIVTYLLDNGAQTETVTMRDETALHLAARANQIEVMRILIRARANVDARAKVSSSFAFRQCCMNFIIALKINM